MIGAGGAGMAGDVAGVSGRRIMIGGSGVVGTAGTLAGRPGAAAVAGADAGWVATTVSLARRSSRVLSFCWALGRKEMAGLSTTSL